MGDCRVSRAIAHGLFALLLGGPAAATAQQGQDPWGGAGREPAPAGQGQMETAPEGAAGEPAAGLAWADFAFHTQEVEGTRLSSLSWTLNGRYTGERFALEATLPLSYFKGGNVLGFGTSKSFMVGNLTLRGLFVHDAGNVHLEVGGLIALPTAKEPDDEGDISSLFLANVTRGLWGYWSWTFEEIGLALPARLEYRADGFGAGVDLALGVTIPIDELSGEDPLGVFQVRGWGGYASESLRAGAFVQSVTAFGAGEEHQASIGPFAEYHTDGGFAGAEALINLDEPYGYKDDGAEVWGIRVYGGVKL